MLRKFGFDASWVDWVGSCINTPRFLVLDNGSPQVFFESLKGIRKGDSLSPFLFIIMVEALG